VRIDINEKYDSLSYSLYFENLRDQLSQSYKDMATILHPKTLSTDSFRHTCSLGLLSCDMNDSLMDFLEASVNNSDQECKPIKFSGSRFRLKLLLSSINNQCMFAFQPQPLKESEEFVDGAIGIAPPGVIQKGDLVCLLFGCNTPIILRPVGCRYKVVCYAYIDNIMDGRAIKYLEDGLFRETVFDVE
jgi:hypothetical protein